MPGRGIDVAEKVGPMYQNGTMARAILPARGTDTLSIGYNGVRDTVGRKPSKVVCGRPLVFRSRCQASVKMPVYGLDRERAAKYRKMRSLSELGVVVMQEMVVRVQFLRNKDTGLLIAMSDDLKGLMVPARSMEEMDVFLPEAIKELMEANGQSLEGVVIAAEADDDSGAFEVVDKATARLTMAA